MPRQAAASGRETEQSDTARAPTCLRNTSMKKFTLIVCAAFIGSTTLAMAFYTPAQHGLSNLSNVELAQAKKDEKKKEEKKK
jgi:hypothetical protein